MDAKERADAWVSAGVEESGESGEGGHWVCNDMCWLHRRIDDKPAINKVETMDCNTQAT